jgi:hypothetical protein
VTDRAELSAHGAEVLRILVWVAVGTFAVTTIAHFVDLTLFGRAVLLLDAESPQSIAGWASTIVLALVAAAAGLLAITRRPVELSMVALAAAMALLSADDDIGIFDQILRHRLPARPDPDLVIWLVSFGPLMGLSVVLLGRLARRIPRDAGRTIAWGFVFLVAAVAGEFLVSLVDIPELTHGMPIYELEAGLEEGFELLGVALIAAALFAILAEQRFTVRAT